MSHNHLDDGYIGRFQRFMLVFYILSFSAGGYTTYMYDYLVMKPSLLCLEETTGGYKSCEVDYVCQNPLVKYKIDWSDPNSLDNWVFKLDLLCK